MAERPRVYLDTNVFIAAYETTGARSDHAQWLLRAVEGGRIEAVTSEITLAELLVRPLEEDASDVAAAYEAIIRPSSGFEVRSVERAILIEAARVRAQRLSIRLPDAIHVATARLLSCGFFVSRDARLSGSGGMAHLPLGPFTLDDILGARG